MNSSPRTLSLCALVATLLPSCLAHDNTVSAIPNNPTLSLLRILCTPNDASITIDDVYRGDIDRWRDATIPLPPGPHRLLIERDGFFPYRIDLQLKPDRTTTLSIDLLRDLKSLDQLGQPPPKPTPHPLLKPPRRTRDIIPTNQPRHTHSPR